VGIVIAPPETQQTTAAFIKETGTTSPILFDQGQVAVSYFRATPQNPSFDVPHLFAVNPAGMIVRDWAQAGAADASLVKQLEQLITGGGAAK
jgi:hypothetical protein